MARIFLSYAHEDLPHARRIVEGLAKEGLEAWWDHEIPPGRSWDEVIGSRIASAGVVIAIWSSHSVGSNFVKEEAQLAYDAGKLLPVKVDEVDPPMGFRRMQAANLVGWQGETQHRQWRALVDETRARLAGAPGPTPPPAPPSAAATPPREATPPSAAYTPPPTSGEAPPRKGLGPWAIGGIVAGGVALAILLAVLLAPRGPDTDPYANPPYEEPFAVASVADTTWRGYVTINESAGCNSFSAGMRYYADGTAQFSFNNGAWEDDRYNWTQTGSAVVMTIARGETWRLSVDGSSMTGSYDDGSCTGTITLTQAANDEAPVTPAPAPTPAPTPAPQPPQAVIPSIAGTTWRGRVNITPSSGCNSFEAGMRYYANGTAQFSFNGGEWEADRYNWSQTNATVVMTIARGETWRLRINGATMSGTYDDGSCSGTLRLDRQ
jgi:hypothetical protein